jgi:hypothetical protein
MPYSFVLSTTSSFAFATSFTSETHPSLPLNASTHRGVVRDDLKKHKRLPPGSQASSLSSIVSSVHNYLPYLLAIEAGIRSTRFKGQRVEILNKTALEIEWRPTLSDNVVPGKEVGRVKIRTLDDEVAFLLSTLANSLSLQARAALRPIYVTSTVPITAEQRVTAIQSASKLLLDAASIYDYLTSRVQRSAEIASPPCADIAASTLQAQRVLALAEATLLFVLKDDPYPAAVAQDRNKNDKEWMFKAPDIPKVRAHLFARVCLEAAQHAGQAHSLALSLRSSGSAADRLCEDYVRYLDDLRRTARAKACRFFGIDAELGGETGKAIGWLHAAMQELGVEVPKEAKKGFGFSKLKKEWSEKREDKRVDKEGVWGADAGRSEEVRVVEALLSKWTKLNDTASSRPCSQRRFVLVLIFNRSTHS